MTPVFHSKLNYDEQTNISDRFIIPSKIGNPDYNLTTFRILYLGFVGWFEFSHNFPFWQLSGLRPKKFVSFLWSAILDNNWLLALLWEQ